MGIFIVEDKFTKAKDTSHEPNLPGAELRRRSNLAVASVCPQAVEHWSPFDDSTSRLGIVSTSC